MLKKLSQYIARKRFRNHIIQPWNSPEFIKQLAVTGARLDNERNHVLREFLEHALKLSGDVAEFGVYKGGTARLIADIMSNSGRKLHLYDTFEGSPKKSAKDTGNRKVFYQDVDMKELTDKFTMHNFVAFHKGLLPQSINSEDFKELCFAHLHLNLYEGTKGTLDYIFRKMTEKGIILIEDYGIIECSGVRKAVDEFCIQNNTKLIYLPTCQGVIIK